MWTLVLASALQAQEGATEAFLMEGRTFDLTTAQPDFSESTGYGYDLGTRQTNPDLRSGEAAPFYFSVRVPDGNYRVRVTLGSRRRAASTAVRAESRRLLVEETPTPRGRYAEVSFVVNKRSPRIDEERTVGLKPREWTYLNWDDRLTLEFAGDAPAVRSITVEPDTVAPTLFLVGNSTVVDQEADPYASWGQMIPRWISTTPTPVAVSNHAESGLAASSFLGQRRLDKVLAMLRPGDYVFVEFGHNDQKEHGVGDGAWYNFAHNLKVFVDRVRSAGGRIAFVTPTQRRNFDADGRIRETHGEYPEAMCSVAAREGVPVVELHEMTRAFFEALGVEGSKQALVHYPAHTYPDQAKPLADNTHFNPYGAYEVAKMVVQGIRGLDAAFAAPLQGAVDVAFPAFDPSRPDDPAAFRWPAGRRADATKPDGN